MSVNLSPIGGAGWQFFGDDGLPLNGGLLYAYLAGSTTPQTTYSDSAGATPNTNPIVLSSTGRPTSEVWLTNGAAYKFILMTSLGVLVGTYDNIAGINDISIGSAFTASLASPPPIGTTTPNVVWATYINVTGSTIPAVGFYRSTTNTLAWATNSTTRGTVNATGNTVLEAPTTGIGLQVKGFAGTHSAQIQDSAGAFNNVGYLEIPQNLQTISYQAVLADSGKHVYMNGTTLTFTIPANGTVPFGIGTCITIVNGNASALSIAITTDVLTKSGTTTTGTRTLAQNGIATIIKVSATSWLINGTALT